MSKILCSTGALIGRPNNRDYHLLKFLSGQLNCDGFEFMMYSTWYNEVNEIISELKAMKREIPVMHCEKYIGQIISRGEDGDYEEALRLFTINCGMAAELGAEKIVIHLWDGTISDSHFSNNLKMFGELQSIAEEHQVDLLVENVVCNQKDPMKHWCELVSVYPKIHFVYDTKMAEFHNQLELLYREEYRWLWQEDHIRHYHVNDYAGGYMDWGMLKTLPIGKGNIDFDRFFAFVKQTGYHDTYTVEATAFDAEGKVDCVMLNECFAKIRSYVK